MSVHKFKVPFITEDDRTCRKNDELGIPRVVEHVQLDVLEAGEGNIGVIVPYTVLALMGDGPFKIFLAAARAQAIIEFDECYKQECPALVSRFFKMLGHDLKMITSPEFDDDRARQFIIVSGVTGQQQDQPSVSALKAQHRINNERRRQERLDILAGRCHPYTSPVDDRMVDAEWRRRNGILLSDMNP